MPIKHSKLMPGAPVPLGNKISKKVLIPSSEAPNFAMRLFTIEVGGSMPLHTNDVEHEQYVLKGTARIVLGKRAFDVHSGDVVYIPALLPHSYENIGDEEFQFICVVPNLPDQTILI